MEAPPGPALVTALAGSSGGNPEEPKLWEEQEDLAATARSHPWALPPAAGCGETALGDLIGDFPCFAQELHLTAFKPRSWAVVLTWAVLWPWCAWPGTSLTPTHWRHFSPPPQPYLITAIFAGDLWIAATRVTGDRVTGPHRYRPCSTSLAITCSSQLASPRQASPSRCPWQRLT